MWYGPEHAARLDAALRRGRFRDVDDLLGDGRPGPQSAGDPPTACPRCRRELVRATLGALAGVLSCPADDGFWLGPLDAERLGTLARSQRLLRVRRRRSRVLLVILAVATVATWGFVLRPRPPVLDADPTAAGGAATDLWSAKTSDRPPALPVSGQAIDAPDELAYFRALLGLLDEAIADRRAFDEALGVSRPPAEYGARWEVFRARQAEVLQRLQDLPVPGRLAHVHRRLANAAQAQTDFYATFVREKLDNPHIDVRGMLGDRDLARQDAELHAAWEAIRELYPDLDHQSMVAIEARLAAFDVI